MKLLFDQNLSHKLAARLADLFPQSQHVRAAGLDRASDEAVWLYAKANGFAIVTQDADFAERSRLFGAPPKVVWLRCGNSTPQSIEALLRSGVEVLAELEQNSGLDCIELL